MRVNRLLVVLAVGACGGPNSITSEVDCTDGVDEDDDGTADCADTDCAADPACPVVELCSNGVDDEVDTFTDCDDDDCWDDPACYTHDDEADLPAPNGDPSADIDKVGVRLASGVATFFITTEGPWPPPVGTYSFFVQVEIDNDGFSPIASAVFQRHAGVEQTIPGGVSAANITVRQRPAGIWVRITGVPAGGVNFYVETGIQKTNPGTRVTDVLGSTPLPLP